MGYKLIIYGIIFSHDSQHNLFPHRGRRELRGAGAVHGRLQRRAAEGAPWYPGGSWLDDF